jgi:PAS domain S-box-containing protein
MNKLLRLLLVEDSENDALLIISTLKWGGYDVVSERVYTPAAMRKALEERPWDVIISDYKIPRFGAIEALQLLSELHLDIPFIVISGAIGEATAVEAMRAGAHDYLMKDNLLRLIPAIEREMRDVQNRAERRRAKSLSLRLGRILDNSPNEIYVFNALTLQLVQINKGALQNSGYSGASLQDIVLYDLAPDLTPAKFAALTHDLYEVRQDKIVAEMLIRRRDNTTFPAEVILSLAETENPPVLVVIVQDITERKQAEEELKALARRLEHSNGELRNFAHVASHDLQEPLRKINLFSQRVAQKYAPLLDDEGKEYIQRMQSSVQRMQTMISDLLKYASLSVEEQHTPTFIDLNGVLQDVVSDLEVHIEQVQGTIHIHTLPAIPAYKTQMYQLFQNLLSNALKYHRPDVPPIVTVSCISMTEACCITVEDNGIGFPLESRDRIFGVFQRLHGRHQYEGNGIGLAICRKIVDIHGGTIHADSVVGEGTKFTITLPLK